MANQSINKDQRNALITACGAHAIQDGLVALHYVLLPILAQVFGLSYAQVGLLKGLSTSAMTLLELPSGVLAETKGVRPLIAFGLIGAGLGYLGVAYSTSYLGIAFCFLISGSGAGFQHALSSSLLVDHYSGSSRRRALGHYNAAGDAGKLGFTGLFSVAVGAGIAWDHVVVMSAILSIGFGLLVFKQIGTKRNANELTPDSELVKSNNRWGVLNRKHFGSLCCAILLDSLVQTIFLTFLGFLFIAKGTDEVTAGFAVVIALSGGMVGKFCCGYIAAYLGDRNTFILLQIFTMIGLAALILLPAGFLLVILPIIGLAVQGTSTVTYGSVGDFISEHRQSRGYALVYSVSNTASIAGPLLFGILADQAGLNSAMWTMLMLTALTIPFSMVLSGRQASIKIA